MPPKDLTLLKEDTLTLFMFDYTTHQPLQPNMTIQLQFAFNPPKAAFFEFKPHKTQANLSSLNIYGSKIPQNRTWLNYTIKAVFKWGKRAKESSKSYQIGITVIDRYKACRANFRNFEENFSIKMRSNDSGVSLPMDYNDIYANNMQVFVEQLKVAETPSPTPTASKEAKNDQKSPGYTKESGDGGSGGSGIAVKAVISQRHVTDTYRYFTKKAPVKMVKFFSFSLESYVGLARRLDIPSKYQVRFGQYDLFGKIVIMEYMNLDYFEWLNVVKMNTYLYLLSANAEKSQNILIFFQIKMTADSLLPWTRLFYNEYKMSYFIHSGHGYGSSVGWFNDQVVWVYRLLKSEIDPKNGQPLAQEVRIDAYFLPVMSERRVGSFTLKGLKKAVEGFVEEAATFQDMICTKIEALSLHKLVFSCTLKNHSKSQKMVKSDHELFAVIQIQPQSTTNYLTEYTISLIDVISPPFDQTHKITSKCFINYGQFTNNIKNQRRLTRPFTIVFYEQGVGYFMKSTQSEHIELLRDSEVTEGMSLTQETCDRESQTLTLRYCKDVKSDGKTTQDEFKLPIKAQEEIYVLNLRAQLRADDRIMTAIRRPSPSRLSDQYHIGVIFVPRNKTLVLGGNGRFPGGMIYYARTYISMEYPRIILTTNSTKNFTADLRVYNSKQAYENKEFGFPVRVIATTEAKLRLKGVVDPPKLKNGEYNLEHFLRISGPMRSFQPFRPSPRIKLRPRAYNQPDFQTPNHEYLHINWIPEIAFFGITASRIVFYDYQARSTSELSYSTKVRSLDGSCCSPKNHSFYVLQKDDDPKTNFFLRVFRVLTNFQKLNKTVFRRDERRFITKEQLRGLQVRDTTQFVKSVADGVVAVVFQSFFVVRVFVVDVTVQGVRLSLWGILRP